MTEPTAQRRCDGCLHWRELFEPADDGDGYVSVGYGECHRTLRAGPGDRVNNRHLIRQVTLPDDTCHDWTRAPHGDLTNDG